VTISVVKYRSAPEIMDAMLRSIKSGVPKTHIMYRAFLSYKQLEEYLEILQVRGLVIYEKNLRLFQITEKGVRYMNVYDELNELVPPTDRKVPTVKELFAAV
jgi:predicted transcriptional regulator